MGSHAGKHQSLSWNEGVKGTVGKSFYCGFHRRNRKDRANRFRRASLNNFSRFWDRGAVPSGLAPPLG